MDNKVKIFIGIIGVLVLGTIFTVAVRGVGDSASRVGEYDEFATCLKDSGTLFYGAFWCPHCQAQKKMFGASARLLPYVECSTADGRSQLEVCKQAGVPSYPYWVFPDGSTLSGEIPLETLAEKTSCPLPGAETDTNADDIEPGAASPAQ